jgi:hypothetical protein
MSSGVGRLSRRLMSALGQNSLPDLIGDERWTVMRGVLRDAMRVVRHRNDAAS